MQVKTLPCLAPLISETRSLKNQKKCCFYNIANWHNISACFDSKDRLKVWSNKLGLQKYVKCQVNRENKDLPKFLGKDKRQRQKERKR